MTENATPTAAEVPQASRFRLKYLAVPLVVVALFGVLAYGLKSRRDGHAPAEQSTIHVVPGGDYYVMVKLVELTSTDPNGKPWDSVNETAPDVRVDIFWRDQRVYRSTVKTDSLIAKWSQAEIDLRKIAITGENTSVESLIRAARISVTAGDKIQILIYDEDVMGEGDQAGEFVIPATELFVGEHTYENVAPAIKRITVTVLPMDIAADILK